MQPTIILFDVCSSSLTTFKNFKCFHIIILNQCDWWIQQGLQIFFSIVSTKLSWATKSYLRTFVIMCRLLIVDPWEFSKYIGECSFPWILLLFFFVGQNPFGYIQSHMGLITLVLMLHYLLLPCLFLTYVLYYR